MICRQSRTDAAFTLVELLVSASIMTLIVGGAYSCFQAGLQASRRVRARSDMLQTGRVALRLMTRDIQAAFRAPLDGSATFEGESSTQDGLAADVLDFVAARVALRGAKSPRSDLCEIGYFVDSDPETEVKGLVRRLDITPDEEPLEGGVAQEVARSVKELDVEYSDGLFWLGDWSSDDGLPEQVRVTVVVVDPRDRERPQVMSAIVHVRMAKFEAPELPDSLDLEVAEPGGEEAEKETEGKPEEEK